jgi:hypothetical protein
LVDRTAPTIELGAVPAMAASWEYAETLPPVRVP